MKWLLDDEWSGVVKSSEYDKIITLWYKINKSSFTLNAVGFLQAVHSLLKLPREYHQEFHPVKQNAESHWQNFVESFNTYEANLILWS